MRAMLLQGLTAGRGLLLAIAGAIWFSMTAGWAVTARGLPRAIALP